MVLGKGQDQAPDKAFAVPPASPAPLATDPGAVTSQPSAEETQSAKVTSADTLTHTTADDSETTQIDVTDPSTSLSTISNSQSTTYPKAPQPASAHTGDFVSTSADTESPEAKTEGIDTSGLIDHNNEPTEDSATISKVSQTSKIGTEPMQTMVTSSMTSQMCDSSTVTCKNTNALPETPQTAPKNKTKKRGEGKGNPKAEETVELANSTGTTAASNSPIAPSPPRFLRVKGPNGQVTTFMLVVCVTGQCSGLD